ncbi:putative oxidoreductase DltE [Vibrio nigripulchritudo]|uniref:SDR family oxidoreductase n=1 Tax=Vibrio nigripulchritudo TaxID=28173 RepID=UPI00190CFEB3|nr:SDR family NAD(P)-dependent oxidoreductase [Vibrio nigripulchritudo]BCL69476.1 putative oxidoreductase DltE [Vibrio nigripulchritudo]BDU30816.1 putative oxidoreductase DltE [Vibrio nigripulchritudo]
MELTNKKIVITGGTSGIGLDVVKSLATRNEVIVIGRDSAKLSQIESSLNVKTYQAELSDIASVEWVASAISNDHPTIDVLINNAAVQFTPSFISSDFRYENIQKEITTNFTSICCLTSLLLPSLMSSASGVVLNVNSGLGLMPKTTSAVYCATKSALNSFSQSLRYQLEGTNVRVLQALMPLVETKMTDGRGSGKLTSEDAAQRLISGIERQIEDNDIGKVKMLRWLMRLSPKAAANLMKRA